MPRIIPPRLRFHARFTALEEDLRPWPTRKNCSRRPIEHIDITRHNVVPLVEAMQHMAFSARDLARAADIYDRMLRDKECGVILCLAGSLISAGLKKVFVDMIRNRMVDCDRQHRRQHRRSGFLRGPGLPALHRRRAAQGRPGRRQAPRAAHRPHLRHADRRGRAAHLRRHDPADRRRAAAPAVLLARVHPRDGRLPGRARQDARTRSCWPPTKHDVPIFCPAFSDCSAGFGLVAHQHARGDQPKVSIDSVKDFYELTQLKIKNPTTGIFMIGGGVPKNFTQDIVVAADILGDDAADAQVRRAGDRGRRARRRPVEPHAQGSLELGQGRHRLTSRWSSAKPRWPCR